MRPLFDRTILLRCVAVATLASTPMTAMAQGGPAPGAGPEGGMRREGAPMRPEGERRREGEQGGMRRNDGMKAGETRPGEMRPGEMRPGEMRPGGRAAERDDRANGPGERRGAEMRRDDRGQGRRPLRTVTTEQRTRVRNIFRTRNVEVIRNVDFPVRIGTPIPARYAFRPLPPEIIDVVPEYAGYDFIDVNGQILILDPVTRDIVAIIE